MSETAYVGLPGSGKSYGIVEHVIIPALSQGREVWTNIPINSDAVMAEFGYLPIQFDIDEIKNDPDWFDNVFNNGSVIIIDECYKLWPAGLNAKNMEESHKSFLAEHRHRVGENGKSTEIVLACQDLSQIANFVRNLVETTYRSVKLSDAGMSKSYRIDVYSGPVTGPRPPERNRLRYIHGKYRADVYKFYQSHTMSDSGGAGDERKIDNRNNILKSGRIIMLPVGLILCVVLLVMFFRMFAAFFGDDEQPQRVKSGYKTASHQSAVPQRKKQLDVLRGRELQIVSNRGRHPDYKYVVEAASDESYFRLTKHELLKLGYVLEPINQCLLRVRVNLDSYLFTCRREENQDFINLNLGAHSDT